MSHFTEHIKIKLEVYSDMIGKNKLEAIYDALSIAISVRKKTIDLEKLFVPTPTGIESRYTIENRLKAERRRLYERTYYKKNTEKLRARKRELRLIKNRKVA